MVGVAKHKKAAARWARDGSHGSLDAPTGPLRQVGVVDGQAVAPDVAASESSFHRDRTAGIDVDDIVDLVMDEQRWIAEGEGRRPPARWEVEDDLTHGDVEATFLYEQHRPRTDRGAS